LHDVSGMTRTFVLVCHCYPPLFKDLADHQSPSMWMEVLEIECKRRGCRCGQHSFGRADVLDIAGSAIRDTGSAA
jgi:hypothetical protein